MSTSQIVGRVKVPAENMTADRVVAPPALSDDALQVLTLAQRTAEEHVAAANQHAWKIREDAEVTAEQIRQEAHAYAEQIRAEADGVLVAARDAAELSSRDAYAQAAEVRRHAELTLDEARAEAERIVAGGEDHAEQLRVQARLRYEDAVGGLSVKREGLQKQIEALEGFDIDYRRRLTSFLQAQMRALWVDMPQSEYVPDGDERQMPGGPVPAIGRY